MTPKSPASPTVANKVRIIGGAWRSRLIRFADSAALRPTPDRVRETLFNWLGQDLSGKTCLDLFAGSGALGFEAASRGAKQVVMVERDRQLIRGLRTAIDQLHATQIELEHRDAQAFLRSDDRQYDVVFLDPPFASSLLSEALALLPPRLADHAVVYVECGAPFCPEDAWSIWKQGRASRVYYYLLHLKQDG